MWYDKNNLMKTIAYFEIQAADPARAVAFYKSIFSWEFKREELLPIEYYRMSGEEGIMGAILKRPAQTPPSEYGTNAYVCSVEVDNFDRVSEKILAGGGEVALPKFPVPGRCWQGYFIDTEGNTFGIFEADENAK
jgi:predicted enzyme related to lactoylglutathione lyase